MKQRQALATLVLAGFLLPALSASAEELSLRATLEDGGKALKISVDGPLPKRAVVVLKVTREFKTLSERSPRVIREVLLPFERAGHAEARYEIGSELAVPGRYRVRASFERQGQYPEVLEAVGKTTFRPAEVVFGEDMSSKEYLESLRAEQAFLADAVLEVERFIDRLAELEAQVAQDKEKGLQAWREWRGQAVKGLERIIMHGREVRERFYPDTYEKFAESLVFAGLFQMESRKFGAAESGGEYHGTGPFHNPEDYQGRKTLAPYAHLFRVETVWCRLLVADALFKGVEKEARDQANPDRARWDRKRQLWEDLLGFWGSDLGEVGPPAVKEILLREPLQALAGSFRGWWDAEQARLFEPENLVGQESEARKKVVQEQFQEIVKELRKTASGPP